MTGQEPRYPLTHQAEERQRPRPIREHLAGIIAALAAVLIVVIIVGVTYRESTATRAADAATVSSPTATPGPPVPQKPTEYSPKIGEVVPGDGTWLIGREIKRGTYRSEGGELCFWERLRNLTGEDNGVMSKGFVNGPQVVAMGPDDVAFSSQGCGQWVMIP